MNAPSPSALTLDGVFAGYGETVVLENISLSLASGRTLAVLGRNGVGKTTLLATIMGNTTRHRGRITFGGHDITALPPYRRARLGLGLVPQEREIFPSLSVEENLTVAAQPGRWTLERVYDFFPSLAARKRNQGNQLSGGEQQMLSIARALMGNPTCLLMDEPLEGLAPVIVDAVLAGLLRLKAEDDLTMILVEQHARVALAFADEAMILDRGIVVHAGPSQPLRDAPERLAELFGIGAQPRSTPGS
jgi:branched-chain amino acid transport system ATP-binding protein